MILIKMAWRNLWRNPKRTFITLFSMVFGLTMMIVGYALSDGMLDQMVRYATLLGTGHIQVHHPGYLKDHSIYDTMDHPEALLKKIADTGLGSASPRVFATALVSSGQQSAGGQLWGIDPVREAKVTELNKHLETGTWLTPDARGDVVLGRNLARTLSVKPGDQIVILTQAADGSLGNALYRVSGTLKSIGEALDRGGVIMNIKDLSQLLVMDNRIHEVAIRLNDPGRLDAAVATLRKVLDQNRYKVQSWKQLFPELAQYLRVSAGSMTLVLAIIFAVASLGIVNTQLMSLFERTREVGIMRALGISPLSVILLILYETLFLVFIAAAIGGLAGSLWSLRLQQVGWDISWMGGTFSFVGVAFDPHMYAALTPKVVIHSIAVMIAVVLLASVYPFFRASRISPVDAIGRGR